MNNPLHVKESDFPLDTHGIAAYRAAKVLAENWTAMNRGSISLAAKVHADGVGAVAALREWCDGVLAEAAPGTNYNQRLEIVLPGEGADVAIGMKSALLAIDRLLKSQGKDINTVPDTDVRAAVDELLPYIHRLDPKFYIGNFQKPNPQDIILRKAVKDLKTLEDRALHVRRAYVIFDHPVGGSVYSQYMDFEEPVVCRLADVSGTGSLEDWLFSGVNLTPLLRLQPDDESHPAIARLRSIYGEEGEIDLLVTGTIRTTLGSIHYPGEYSVVDAAYQTSIWTEQNKEYAHFGPWTPKLVEMDMDDPLGDLGGRLEKAK